MNICGHFDFGYDIRCKRMSEKNNNIGASSNTSVSL
jgi:hypothetical protein